MKRRQMLALRPITAALCIYTASRVFIRTPEVSLSEATSIAAPLIAASIAAIALLLVLEIRSRKTHRRI